MSKVLIDRELLAKASMLPSMKSMEANRRDIVERGRAQAVIRDLLAAGQPEANVLSILRDARESVHYHKGMQNLGHEAGQRHAVELAALIERIDAVLNGGEA